MKAYIQSNEDGLPHHFDAACALYGAIDSGYDYKLISYDRLDAIDPQLFKENLFVGSVEFMTKIFDKLGKSPRVPDNSNRDEETVSLSEAKARVLSGERLFIKPRQIKLFTGSVMTRDFISCLNPYPDDTEVIVCKPFESEIASEWRCYVRKALISGPIADIRCYSGDPFATPNKDYILEVFNENISRYPKAYTIDVGMLSDGSNVVIEYNDMWSIGNYGMDNSIYFSLLKERYFEIARGI
jgi:hypothetical protein